MTLLAVAARGAIFSFSLAPINFHKLGGRRRNGGRWLLLSEATILVCMPGSRERERVGRSVLLLWPFNCLLAGGGDKSSGGYLLSEAALLACMLVSWEVEPRALLLWRLWLLHFAGVGVGVGVFGGSPPSSAALLMSISAGGESKRARQFCLLRFHHSIFTDWVSGGGGVPTALYSRRWWFGMHASGSRGRSRGIYFLLRFRCFVFTDWVGEIKRSRLLLLSAVVLSVCLPTDRE